MAIIRACSYSCSIKTPEAPSEYSKILVSIAQNGQTLINKTQAELQTTASSVIMQLTQEETKLFKAPGRAFLQVRCYKSTYNAPGSKLFAIDVWPANNDEVLS